MGTSINNSFILPTNFPLAETDSSNPENTDSTSEKSLSQGQGGVSATAPGTGTTSAYATLQGAQGQNGQNINNTLSQVLGATQGSIADSGSAGGDNDFSGILNNDGTMPQAVDIGLSANEQVGGSQQGSREKKDSGTGSGSQSEQGEIYMGSAASGLQKGQGTQSSTVVSSTSLTSNFTLKVDSTESTSTTTTQSTSYTDSNGAPKIPNVYAMIADCTELSENLNGYTVSEMVAANNGQNNTLSQEYSQQITDINNYITAKAQSKAKSSVAKAFSWVVNIAMIAVGCLTADPMLVAAGVMGCVLTADPKITAGLTSALEKMGIPSQAANILSTLIIIGAASIGGFGVGAIGMGAMRAGSEAAIEVGTESVTESTADTALESSTASATKDASQATAKAATKSMNWRGTWDALQTSSGRSAFMKGAAKGATKTVVDAPANIAGSIAKIPASVADSAASLYKLAARVSDSCMSLGSKSLKEMLADMSVGSAKAGEMSTESLQSLFSNMTSMEPMKMVQISADLTMAALSASGSVVQYNAAILQAKAQKDQAYILESQAQTTELNTLISLSNSQIQTVLNDMNSAVVNAGQVLSGMSSLSSETLGQLNRGAA